MRTIAQVVVGLLFLSALAVGQAAAEGEQWLQYRTAADPYRHEARVGPAEAELLAERPEGVALPDLKSDKAVFARWKTPMVKAGFLWIVLDSATERGSLNRLYIDTDCDGSLADETAVVPNQDEGQRTRFGPVKIVFPGDDGPVTYHLNVTRYDYPEYKKVYTVPGCWYEGQVEIGGKRLRFMNCDGNANGAYDETDLDWANGDQVLFHNGEEMAIRMVGKYLKVGDAYYPLQVARDGSWVKFGPAESPPMATVVVPKGTTNVSVLGPMGHYRLDAGAEGRFRVPAGTYTFEYWVLPKTDSEGRQWTIRGSKTPKDKAFELKADKEWAAPVGESAAAVLTVAKDDKGMYGFNLKLLGRLGENVAVRPSQGNTTAKLHITNESGDYHKTLIFTYG